MSEPLGFEPVTTYKIWRHIFDIYQEKRLEAAHKLTLAPFISLTGDGWSSGKQVRSSLFVRSSRHLSYRRNTTGRW